MLGNHAQCGTKGASDVKAHLLVVLYEMASVRKLNRDPDSLRCRPQ